MVARKLGSIATGITKARRICYGTSGGPRKGIGCEKNLLPGFPTEITCDILSAALQDTFRERRGLPNKPVCKAKVRKSSNHVTFAPAIPRELSDAYWERPLWIREDFHLFNINEHVTQFSSEITHTASFSRFATSTASSVREVGFPIWFLS